MQSREEKGKEEQGKIGRYEVKETTPRGRAQMVASGFAIIWHGALCNNQLLSN